MGDGGSIVAFPGKTAARGLSGLRAAAVAAALALSVSGCALLGGGPAALDTYDLSAPDTAGAGQRRGRVQILVTEPTAIKVLDGENIVVKTGPNAIEFLGGAQWADRLPRVVQARLAQTFQESGRFGGVGKPGEGLAIDYQVMVEIRAFEIRVDGSARAVAEFFVRILNDRNGTVRAARTFTASVPVGSGDANAAYTQALDAAFGIVAAEIVGWTISAI